MVVAKGILTARGGMTSHAAVVARGMGKCCVSGAGSVRVDPKARTMTIEGVVYNEGDWISLDGSTGKVYEGKVPTKDAELSGDFGKLMELADRYKRLAIRANADSPEDAKVARNFGAVGIGLCRTEHMFFEGDRIKSVREMILAQDVKAAIMELQVGEALVSLLDANGTPGITQRAFIVPPVSSIGPIDPAQRCR